MTTGKVSCQEKTGAQLFYLGGGGSVPVFNVQSRILKKNVLKVYKDIKQENYNSFDLISSQYYYTVRFIKPYPNPVYRCTGAR